MSDYRVRVLESVRETGKNMARVRGVSYLSMLRVHAVQCAENLRDSVGTTEEIYWRIRLEVCDTEAAEVERGELVPRG